MADLNCRPHGPEPRTNFLSECWESNPVALRPERSVIPVHYTPKILRGHRAIPWQLLRTQNLLYFIFDI